MAKRRKPTPDSASRKPADEDLEDEDDEEELDEEESSEEEEDLEEDEEEEDEDDDSTAELDRLRSNIRKLRANERKGKADRKRLADAEAELKKFRDKELSAEERTKAEAEDAKDRADKAEKRLRDRDRQDSIHREARRQGAVDEEAVYRLIDLDDLEEDEDGQIENAREVVAALLKKKPFLLKDEGDGSGRARFPQTPGTRGRNTPSKAEIEKRGKEDLLNTGRYS
jgi:hypothetical protein